MALCDRLEVQLQARETQQAALARAALARFADAPTPANLELLFHPAFAVAPADLRKSILTLAVQGKLVVNNPSEEPVALKVSDNLLNPLSFPKNWRTGLIGDIYIFEYAVTTKKIVFNVSFKQIIINSHNILKSTIFNTKSIKSIFCKNYPQINFYEKRILKLSWFYG